MLRKSSEKQISVMQDRKIIQTWNLKTENFNFFISVNSKCFEKQSSIMQDKNFICLYKIHIHSSSDKNNRLPQPLLEFEN